MRVTARLITIPVVVHVVYRTGRGEHLGRSGEEPDRRAQQRLPREEHRQEQGAGASGRPGRSTPTSSSRWPRRTPRASRPRASPAPPPRPRASAPTTRVKSRKTGGVDAWPTDSYLNMWVCNLAEGLLGYAQFPGGPAADRRGGDPLHRLREPRQRPAAVQQGPHRHARGRPLPRPAPHLGRHATTAPATTSSPTRRPPSEANTGKPTVPAHHLQQRPARRHVHELHGLRGRRRDVHVHGGQVARMNATLAGPRKKLAKL